MKKVKPVPPGTLPPHDRLPKGTVIVLESNSVDGCWKGVAAVQGGLISECEGEKILAVLMLLAKDVLKHFEEKKT
jgi:hypothetical protein